MVSRTCGLPFVEGNLVNVFETR